MSNVRKIIAIALTISICTPQVTFANQSQIDKNKNQISTLEGEKDKLEDQKVEINEEIAVLIEQMKDKQYDIDILQDKVDLIQRDIDELQSSIDAVTKDIEVAEKDIEGLESEYIEKETEQRYQQEVLRSRVKRAYINNTYNEFLAIILDSESLSEILFKVKYVNDILNHDKDIIQSLKEVKLDLAESKYILEQEKETLARKKDDLQKSTEALKSKQEEVLKEKSYLDIEMEGLQRIEDEKQEKIKQLSKSQKYLDEQIYDLTMQNSKLEGDMHSASNGTGNYGTSTFIKPTTGTYTSPYGYRIHPITKKRSFHSGCDIANSAGTKIVASDSGKVVRASYYGAYGNTIIIDHGNGYSTMYAHLQAYSVGVGDMVSQGQKIGEMGSTGWSTGPHLHFEIWKKGQHVNPRNYI